MSVKLIWITPEAEKLIIYMARVSSPQNQQKTEYTKLVHYLIDHSHWSPFDMASCCFEIKTSRAITAQILRHKSMFFQEASQRYSQVQSIEKINPRSQDNKNRQSSHDNLSKETKEWFDENVEKLNNAALEFYNQALDKGVAKESARFCLPMASSSCLYVHSTIRSMIHYINLRTKTDTQLEHREVANEIKQILIKELPIISKAVGWTE